MPAGSKEQPLDFLEEQFLVEYLECNNYAEAARRCGMDYKSATNLSERHAFKREVLRIQTTAMGRAEITVQRLMEELACIAFLNPKDLLNSDGMLKDIQDLPDPVARAIGGLKVKTTDSEKYTYTTVEPKLNDKMRAIELLGKTAQLRMFTEVTEINDVSKPGATQMDLDERVKLMGESRDPSLMEPE
jgi:phage terminase small subunit